MASTRPTDPVRRLQTDEDFLSTREAADMLRMSMRTLARWRMRGNGRGYHKFGRRVLYRLRDVKEWADGQSVGNRAWRK